MNVSNYCSKLLDSGKKYDITYGNGLSNHLPMGLIALDKMGAGEYKLQEFYDEYKQKLKKYNQDNIIELVDIKDTLGEKDIFPSLVKFFKKEIDQKGVTGVISKYINILLPGVAASAFHALIRLSYAILADSSDEVAISLAYWCSEYQPIGELSDKSDVLIPDIIINAKEKYKNYTFNKGNITERIVSVVNMSEYKQLDLEPGNINMEEISGIALTAYLSNPNIALLHGVTSCQALRLLLPYFSDEEMALRYYWQALLGLFLSNDLGIDKMKEKTEKINLSIPKIDINSFYDVHSIKLFFSCIMEYKYYGYCGYIEVMKNLQC